ncbi:nucleotidyltransferase domain-containing protein [Pseudoalteromonas luteoviolacea]|nr:nucleotidyltransferase domain-containing protein [Pseudoalteromonas luteoviolacea]
MTEKRNKIAPEIHDEIMERIKNAEREYNVKVLYAIESGSRAWGFESPNSDFDVRFIYVHKQDWYLSVMLEDKRDVIEYPIIDDIDINGWELRKALKLLHASNPAIGEWLQSSIVYVNCDHFKHQAMSLFKTHYRVDRGIYHYFNMAKNNYRAHLKADLVSHKKYLYVLRALCAVKWIERFHCPPPIEFETLASEVIDDSILLDKICSLVTEKKRTTEKTLGPKIPELNAFIEAQLSQFKGSKKAPPLEQNRVVELDSFFQKMLRSIN